MKAKIITLALVALLSVCSVALAASEELGLEELIPVFSSQETNIAPMDAVTVMATNTGTVRFTQSDFLDCVAAGEELRGIIITTLPTTGRLSLDGRAMIAGEAVTVEQLAGLSFIPASVSPASVTFSILPVLQSGVYKTPVPVSMEVRKPENRCPIAENLELQTYKNVPIIGFLKANDPDGDTLEYRIMTKPKRGDILLGEGGSFTYTPFQNKSGKDKITYVVCDSFGNVSAEATITIEIAKPSTKNSYADMSGHAAAYAAIRLMEEDIFTGEQICGSYYFNPDTAVTRGEFIAMAMRAVGITDPDPAVITGFADDKDIPTWIKPYAQAALKAGIINGEESADGRKSFNANRPITMSEAAIVLNGAIRIANVNAEADTAVPAWAAQAAVNLDAVGVLPVGLTNEKWRTGLTRADAAELLSRTINVATSSKDNNGLLSWVFGY